MKSLFKKLALMLTIIGFTSSAMAIGYGGTSTYSNINWSASINTSSIPSSCNQLKLDATGDFVNSSVMMVYGSLNCPAFNSGYAATGTAYFDTNGQFNMTVTFGNGYIFFCGRLSGLSGVCTIYNNVGITVGTTYLTLQ